MIDHEYTKQLPSEMKTIVNQQHHYWLHQLQSFQPSAIEYSMISFPESCQKLNSATEIQH